MMAWNSRLLVVALFAVFLSALAGGRDLLGQQPASAEDAAAAQAGEETLAGKFTIRNGDRETTLDARVLVEAADGGLLLETADTRIWMVQPADRVAREPLPDGLEPLTVRSLEQMLLAELPAGFNVRSSKHFVVAYNTDPLFARWVSNLYERLLKGFREHWLKKRDYRLEEPKTPLAVIVFGNREEYAAHVRRELGTEPGAMVAYYNLMTNRVALYDLTSEFAPAGGPVADIPTILRSPGAAEMVATIIHEGTHQLMFNTGMQRRFADTPLWVNEGLATWFETPDADSGQGFRTIGQVNPLRLRQFQAYLATRPADSLATLIGSDSALREPEQMANRYGEAWALCYYLLERHEEAFVSYLQFLSRKPLLVYDSPEQRLADFTSFFPEGPAQLDAAFVDWISRLER